MQIQALRNLGLNIRRARLRDPADRSALSTKFYITDARTSEKVLKSEKLEEIRLTILHNMLEYHPVGRADQRTSRVDRGSCAGVRPPVVAAPLSINSVSRVACWRSEYDSGVVLLGEREVALWTWQTARSVYWWWRVARQRGDQRQCGIPAPHKCVKRVASPCRLP